MQLYPTHVPSTYGITQYTTHPDQFNVVPQFFHLHAKTHQLHARRTKERKHAHFNSPVPSPTNNFISHEVHTIHLVRMSRKVGLNFIRLQIPYLPTHHQKTSVNSTKGGQQTLSVLSLLALINNRLSALHASRYTAPTWPRSVATNLPVRPSHTRTLLSQAADAAHRPSGEKATWETWRWWPVSRAMGLVEERGDQRKRVWSSEPEMSSSVGEVRRRVVYRVCASFWAVWEGWG